MEIRAEELILVVKAISNIPGLGKEIVNKFSDTEFRSKVLSKFCELAGMGHRDGYRLAQCLLASDTEDKRSDLYDSISEHITNLSEQQFKSVIKCKKDGQEVALSLSILDDYLEYLSNGVWNGPKKLDDKALSIKEQARELANVAELDLYDTYLELDSAKADSVKDILSKLGTDELAMEIYKLYCYISRCDKDDICDKTGQEGKTV